MFTQAASFRSTRSFAIRLASFAFAVVERTMIRGTANPRKVLVGHPNFTAEDL